MLSLYYLSMQLQCCKDETEWISAANLWVQDHCRKFNVRRLFLPAGETPKPLYAFWERERPDFLRDLTFVQIDDVVTGPTSFSKQFEFFADGEKGADLALLGLGMNGHVAFHEPGLSSAFYSGCVELSSTTRTVLSLTERTWGATYGLDAFRKCCGVLILVRGEKKRAIARKVLAQDKNIPAGQLANFQSAKMLTDFIIEP
jgi:6-phosphogluconolactonase/glucosamine-6-phosphate isomerase/deaminase